MKPFLFVFGLTITILSLCAPDISVHEVPVRVRDYRWGSLPSLYRHPEVIREGTVERDDNGLIRITGWQIDCRKGGPFWVTPGAR